MKPMTRSLIRRSATFLTASTLLVLPSNAFLVPPIQSQRLIGTKRIRLNNNNIDDERIIPVSCENSMEDVSDVDGSPSNTTASSVPFPRSSYHFSRDEEEISYDFISFIDHFDEPYTHVSRLIEPRRYARSGQFDGQQVTPVPPTIDDVAGPPSPFGPLGKTLAWNTLSARIVVGTLAYITFPTIIDLLESFTTADYVVRDSQDNISFFERAQIMFPIIHAWSGSHSLVVSVSKSISEEERQNLARLVNFYLPGISIVLGTYFSMTLNILYTRYSELQQIIALEASMLAYCFQLLLDLFAKDRKNLIPSAQCIADQIGVLVRDSRGKETMRIIYNDPYAEILHIVQNYSRRPGSTQPQDATLVGVIRDCVKQLFEVRSKRLNQEALDVAPAHFDVMTFLSGLLLVGIALGTVATAQTDGVPTEVSRILFSALVVCYTVIYEMSFDLNRPFDGVYQIQRSGAATHFLQIKHMVATHPVLRDVVSFDPLTDEKADPTVIPTIDEDEKRDVWFN